MYKLWGKIQSIPLIILLKLFSRFMLCVFNVYTLCTGILVGIQRGDRGSRPPPPSHLKIHGNIGFPSNIGPDPLIITKLPSQH